jgi:TldD protein
MDSKNLKFEEIRGFGAELVASLEAVLPYAAVFAARQEGLRVMASSTQSSVTPEIPHPGMVVTLFNGETFYEYATNRFDAALIRQETLALARRAAGERGKGKGMDLEIGERLERDFSLPIKTDPRKVSVKEKQDYAKSLQASLAKASARVQNAVAVVGDLSSEEIFVNRSRNLRQSLQRVDEMIQVIVADQATGRVQQLWDGASRGGGWELMGYCHDRVKPLVADAERLLKAGRLSPGTYEIVTDSEWSGILAHEAFGHGTETDMFPKDRAKGREYMNKRVASDITSLVDDPSLPGQAATFYFDHEGALARRNQIIDKGTLVHGMTDFYSASLLKLPRSANGRRESWERKAYARMTNTFFEAGQSKPSAMIASVEDGIYLRYPSNGMEDPQGWGIQCEGLWAQRIKKGKLSDEIHSPVIMTGFVPDILQSISMVGDDMEISGLGYCGKGHKEIVKNTMGGPHLKFTARLA